MQQRNIMNKFGFFFCGIHIAVVLFLVPDHVLAKNTVFVCSGHSDYKSFMLQHQNSIVGGGSELTRLTFTEFGKECLPPLSRICEKRLWVGPLLCGGSG